MIAVLAAAYIKEALKSTMSKEPRNSGGGESGEPQPEAQSHVKPKGAKDGK